MKFSSYFIELIHPEPSFTGNLVIDGEAVYTNFKKIGENLFTAFFKNQVELKFLEEIEFKNRNKNVTVLFPVISKYNKRKITKIAKILDKSEAKEKNSILFDFLTLEKILRVAELLNFFSFDREEMVRLLIGKELAQEIKIIDFSGLTVISYETFLGCREELSSIFNNYLVNRDKSIKIADVEVKLKLPRSSIFFKYLLAAINEKFSFRIIKDKIVFPKLTLSGKEKEAIEKIENIVKKNKLPIFTIDEVLKSSGLRFKEVNDLLWYMVHIGTVVQLNKKYFIFEDDLNKIINKLKKYKRNQGEMISISAFREMTLYSRKYIIALFEYFDLRRLTKRVENERKILLVV
ncbi:MAG: SelB C-terminal domain-containing protein [Candidatus Aminicenantes bacterium]|nr:SelB C-terminal domain-containing protein [Candidatus Aminicenantes bacterium]